MMDLLVRGRPGRSFGGVHVQAKGWFARYNCEGGSAGGQTWESGILWINDPTGVLWRIGQNIGERRRRSSVGRRIPAGSFVRQLGHLTIPSVMA